jgi:prepilin-type N-terminal cleavage/methylation domain-containing protein
MLATARGEQMKRKRKGFTLIEVMIVMVILSILCAITIPRFANTKQRTYVTAMKADLRNLATYQEMYAADSLGNYFSGDGQAQGFHPSQSVTVTATAVPGPPSFWTANAIHSLTTKTCSVSVSGVTTCT